MSSMFSVYLMRLISQMDDYELLKHQLDTVLTKAMINVIEHTNYPENQECKARKYINGIRVKAERNRNTVYIPEGCTTDYISKFIKRTVKKKAVKSLSERFFLMEMKPCKKVNRHSQTIINSKKIKTLMLNDKKENTAEAELIKFKEEHEILKTEVSSIRSQCLSKESELEKLILENNVLVKELKETNSSLSKKMSEIGELKESIEENAIRGINLTNTGHSNTSKQLCKKAKDGILSGMNHGVISSIERKIDSVKTLLGNKYVDNKVLYLKKLLNKEEKMILREKLGCLVEIRGSYCSKYRSYCQVLGGRDINDCSLDIISLLMTSRYTDWNRSFMSKISIHFTSMGMR